MAYGSFQDLQSNVPGEYARGTTSEKVARGLNRVAPPGKSANREVCDYYESQTNEEAGRKLVQRWGTSRLFS